MTAPNTPPDATAPDDALDPVCADCGATPVWEWQVGDVTAMTFSRILCDPCGRAWIESPEAAAAVAGVSGYQ